MRVVIISNNDWDGLWYQRQQYASMYAEHGIEVLFINKTLQRMPHLKDFLDRFFVSKSVTKIKANPVPKNVELKTIYTLPPFKWLNAVNKFIVSYNFKSSKWKNPDLIITYLPTYTALDIIKVLSPLKWAYINVHNYNADNVISDLLESEKIVCEIAPALFADSDFNKNRIELISKGRKVYYSEPGVSSKMFLSAYRGDEYKRLQTICYFGGIGNHLDFDMYNKLSEHYNVLFIGQYNSADVVGKLSSRIKIIPPVTNRELPDILKNVDVMGLFYNKCDYVNGVIPAKIYECISTLKPVVTTGMDCVSRLGKAVYICTEDNVVDTLEKLVITETEDVIAYRKKIANEADWERRFENLNKRLELIWDF